MNQDYGWKQSQGSSGGFFTGLLAGTLIGAGLGVLFAPRRGTELRGQVADSAANVGQTISKTVDDWAERGRDAYQRGRDGASRVGDEVSRAANEAARTMETTLKVGGDAAAGATRQAGKYVGRV
jgi:gas vesicle protein